ncbi:MAG: type II secretion system GspH family protein [Synergistaceae bacterium]|jgi:prepilin-type N-terminal cleavage/methylation domain-containing protein|nr:type II secretion system GspH family protein [Synergistaceae bacterium]
MLCGRRAFSLLEVLAAVAILGLVTAGGFRLFAMSLRTLSEVNQEQALISETQKIYLDFLTKEDMPDAGEKDGVKWKIEVGSVSVAEGVDLSFRKLFVEFQGREMVLYLSR